MLDLAASTSIYIQLALGHKESNEGGRTLLLGKKTPTNKTKKPSYYKNSAQDLSFLTAAFKALAVAKDWICSAVTFPTHTSKILIFLTDYVVFNYFLIKDRCTLQFSFRKKTNAGKKEN